jgi:hypothetical protein
LRLSSRASGLVGLGIALSELFGGSSLARIIPSLNNANNVIRRPIGPLLRIGFSLARAARGLYFDCRAVRLLDLTFHPFAGSVTT